MPQALRASCWSITGQSEVTVVDQAITLTTRIPTPRSTPPPRPTTLAPSDLAPWGVRVFPPPIAIPPHALTGYKGMREFCYTPYLPSYPYVLMSLAVRRAWRG